MNLQVMEAAHFQEGMISFCCRFIFLMGFLLYSVVFDLSPNNNIIKNIVRNELYIYDFGCSKKVTNKTRQVVNSTQISGAAERFRFLGLSRNGTSGVSKELVLFFVVVLSSLLFFPFITPPC